MSVTDAPSINLLDPSFYVIRLLQLFGIVWDVRTPPKHVVDTPGDEPLVNRLKKKLPELEAAAAQVSQAAQEAAAQVSQTAAQAVEAAKEAAETAASDLAPVKSVPDAK